MINFKQNLINKVPLLMIIYNVTIKVDSSIHYEWLSWLREDHVPSIMSTGCFTDATISRLLEVDELDGPTYTIQYYAESKGLYNQFIEKYADDMRQISFDKWGDRFIAFRSVMQVIN